ncbi:hypothetical protein FACS1894216_11840 [Synergistales bacterium]|nr:hypothetical protein FACS1894216_11840 [Synergistales bacterium]
MIVIAAVKQWSMVAAKRFCRNTPDIHTHVITSKDDITYDALCGLNPDYVFFPHYSYYIPRVIFENFTCIVFHPTDVPYGRGGSPIQNLISKGHTETVISAIRVDTELDAGDVYLKRPLSLVGGGEEILIRMQNIIFGNMIPAIVRNKITPLPQSGEVTGFKRRTPEMSELNANMTIEEFYDAIRMLDIEGYPKAYIRFGDYTLTFSRPCFKTNGVMADVAIERNVNDN